MIKYSVLMPFYNRSSLLNNTLLTYNYLYKSREDIEILIGIDSKCTDEEKVLCRETLKVSLHNTTAIEVDNEGCYNPSKVYNALSQIAKGDIFVLTNPEIQHETAIFCGLDEEFTNSPNKYIVCACKNGDGWYQHSLHNNRKLHFLSAITAVNYQNIGGFDEEYSKGISYDDDDLIRTVEDYGLDVILRDDLIGVHQDHPRDYIQKNLALVEKNRRYYINKWIFV